MRVRDRSEKQIIRTTLIVVVFVAALLFGAVFRILSGHEILSSSLIYAPSVKVRYPGSRTPQDTAVSFYLSIDNGDYERAYELILEPRWTELPASYRDAVDAENGQFKGWTGEREFLQRLRHEIGPGGSGIKLNSVRAHVLHELKPDLYARAFGINGLRSAYSVNVEGSILGACSIFSWKKELTVLQVGRRYKVFLDGGKEANSFYYQSWFTGFEKIGDLRSSYLESSDTEAVVNKSILTHPLQYGGSSEHSGDLKIPTGCPCGGGS